MLRLVHLSKSFGANVAVDDLTLEIRTGEVFGFLGPNGAGKTTAINMAVGLFQPDQGTVEVVGHGSPTQPEVRRKIGVAPQALALYDELSAEENLAFFVSTLGISTALILFSMLVFAVRPKAPLLLVGALLSISTCFVGIMMLLSVVGRTERAAGGIGWAVLMVMAMLGGGMVPLFIMPAWMQTISHVSPVKWSILAMEGAIWRGFSPGEMLLPCAILLAVGVVFFTVGSRAFRWTEG